MQPKNILLAACFTVFTAQGQSETYDILTFSPPAGYTRQPGKDYIQFIRFNDEKTAYCTIAIYSSRQGTDDIKGEFVAEWNDLIKKTTEEKVEAPAETQQVGPDNGWTVRSGTSLVKFSKGDFVVMLVSLAGHGRVTSIRIDINTNNFEADISAFIASLKPESKIADDLAVPSQSKLIAVTQAVSSGAHASSFSSNNPVVGVWWGLRSITTAGGITNAAGTGYSYYGTSTTNKLRQIAFFGDGSFCNVVSSDGLLDQAQQRSKYPDYWGNWTFDKGTGSIHFGASLTYPISIENAILVYNQDHYYKVLPNDHQFMEGTYTAEKDPAAYIGSEPTIEFSLDGRFADHGAIYWTRHVKGYTEDMQDKMTGSGKYEVVDYTIIFTYDDGRLIGMTFLDTGSADKARPAQMRLGNFHLLDRK